MVKKTLVFLIIISLSGCQEKEIKTIIDEKNHISINYPITNVHALDNEVTTYINKIYNNFKNNKYSKELNISYTYKEINNDIINISLCAEIKDNKITNKIKTFTYNKQTKQFLSLENIIGDLDILDYDLKKNIIEKYKEIDMNYLNSANINDFKFDDENLTIYLNPINLKNKKDLVYLDIPLNSLKLLIDIDKSDYNDVYLNIKKRDLDYEDKIVALTFDDGPSKYTDKILNILSRNDAVGTFFVIGNKVEFYNEVLIKMLKGGNEIGNHSYDHKMLTNLTEKEFKEEINKTQNIIKKTTGFTPTLFRPTYGGYTNRLRSYTDLTFILWDVDSKDWQVKRKDKIINNIMKDVKSGSIVLMHDNHKYSLDALEEIIKELKNQKYKFVTVSELLELTKLRNQE